MNYALKTLSICFIGLGAVACQTAETNQTPSVPENDPVVVNEATPSQKLKVIAMVNSDSILSQYEYALHLRDDLNDKTVKFETTLRQMESKLRTEMEQLQRDAPTLSQFEGQNRQNKLIRAQENLQLKQEEYTRKLMEIEQGYNRDIHNSIKEFLNRYCADKPYEMVLSNSDLGIIRWADKELDITSDVLKGLNEEYAAQNAQSAENQKAE